MRSNSQSKTNKPKTIDDDTPAVLEANLSGPTIVPEQYSTTEQHEALEKLINEIYGLDLKAFVSDAAEIIGNYSGENSEMVELLWEASTAD